MESELKRKKARLTPEDAQADEQDRIGRLSDDLIHIIMSFLDIQLSVQTCVLSKRWKLVWTTLPFLKFRYYYKGSPNCSSIQHKPKFVAKVLKHRNHQSQLSSLKLSLLTPGIYARFLNYAISHRVGYLNVQLRTIPYKLSNFNSTSIEKLKLKIKFEDTVLESNCWDLPALKTLHLTRLHHDHSHNLPELCLTSLPALTTLCLTDWNLAKWSFCFNLPALTTLRLTKCKLVKEDWNFPALKSLVLHDVVFADDMRHIFVPLVSLRNLTLFFNKNPPRSCVLPCPKLVNLNVRTRYHQQNGIRAGGIVFVAPKLRNFTCVGICSITLRNSKLNKGYVKLKGWIDHMVLPREMLKEYYQKFARMLSHFHSAKILYLDLETIEALSSITDYLVRSPSPFHKLKYLKLPLGCKEENICSTVRSYLLGGSPAATIVTTFPQKKMIPRTKATSATAQMRGPGHEMNTIPSSAPDYVTAQNVVMQEPLAAPTKMFFDSENIHKTVCIDTVDIREQENDMVQNCEVHSDRVRHVGGGPVEGSENDRAISSKITIHSSAPDYVTAQNVVMQEPLADPTKVFFDSENIHKTVCIDTVDIRVQENDVVQNSDVHTDRVKHVGGPGEGSENDRASSSRENIDFGIWRGHEVNSEFACLLDLIMNNYPETFEHFTTADKKLSTMKLNMLCTSVNVFTKISMTQVDTAMIAEYRDVFAGLQSFGFNVSWLMSRLNYIEQLRFSQPLLSELHAIDCHISSAKSKLQDLETLRDKKMQEIEKAFGTMGTNLVVGCIGDNLLRAP